MPLTKQCSEIQMLASPTLCYSSKGSLQPLMPLRTGKMPGRRPTPQGLPARRPKARRTAAKAGIGELRGGGFTLRGLLKGFGLGATVRTFTAADQVSSVAISQGSVVGDGFNAERFLRIEPSGGAFGVDRDNHGQNCGKSNDERAKQRHNGSALCWGISAFVGRRQYRIPLKSIGSAHASVRRVPDVSWMLFESPRQRE